MSTGIRNKNIISLVGRQGSGKTTIGERLALYLGCPHIEVSSVVKSLNKGLPRAELPSTTERTKEDPLWLIKEIETRFGPEKNAILTGVREKHIHDYFAKNNTLVSFEVKCDAEIRLQRLLEIGKVKNAAEFLEHELKEMAMDVITLEFLAPYCIPTSPYTDPDKIVRAIVVALQERGVEFK